MQTAEQPGAKPSGNVLIHEDPLEAALILAAKVHVGKLDKGGEPYILHPLRLALRMETDDERIVALLHDVLEHAEKSGDADGVRGQLEEFGSTIAAAVECLTRRPREDYDVYIARVRANPLASAVKLADLYDNLDPRRLRVLTSGDLQRVLKYHQALRALEEACQYP